MDDALFDERSSGDLRGRAARADADAHTCPDAYPDDRAYGHGNDDADTECSARVDRVSRWDVELRVERELAHALPTDGCTERRSPRGDARRP